MFRGFVDWMRAGYKRRQASKACETQQQQHALSFETRRNMTATSSTERKSALLVAAEKGRKIVVRGMLEVCAGISLKKRRRSASASASGL